MAAVLAPRSLPNSDFPLALVFADNSAEISMLDDAPVYRRADLQTAIAIRSARPKRVSDT